MGEEPFHLAGTPIAGTLLDFWRWSASDLLVNTARGLVAEYIVAHALGIATDGVRDGWAAFDLKTDAGIKVEVKSCSYLQSWFQKQHSYISFGIKESTAWNPDTNTFEGGRRRQADVYVFALLAHHEKATLDLLDVSQWEFYVLATSVLNERHAAQGSIGLNALRRLNAGPYDYSSLATAVAAAGRAQSAYEVE